LKSLGSTHLAVQKGNFYKYVNWRFQEPSGDGFHVALLAEKRWGKYWHGKWNDQPSNSNHAFPTTCYLRKDKPAIPSLTVAPMPKILPDNMPEMCESCWTTGFTDEPFCTYAGQILHSRDKNVPDLRSCAILCSDLENCQVAIFNQHSGNCVLRSEYIGNNGKCYISGNDRMSAARKCQFVPECLYPNGMTEVTTAATTLPTQLVTQDKGFFMSTKKRARFQQ